MGNDVPAPVSGAIEAMRALHGAMRQGLVRACHDLSEGGLAVAAAEMALAGRLGLEMDLESLPRADGVDRDDVVLFSESSARFLVEVAEEDAAVFAGLMAGVPWACVGRVGGDSLCVIGLSEQVVLEADLDSLKTAWKGASLV